MKVKILITLWWLTTLIGWIMTRTGTVTDDLFFSLVVASGATFSTLYLSCIFSNRVRSIWNEVKEMPITGALKALAFSPDTEYLLSEVRGINGVFYDILSFVDAQSLGVELAVLFGKVNFNNISLPLAVKIKLFKFYQKYSEQMEIIDEFACSGLRRKDLLQRIPEMELYIIDLSKIMDNLDIEKQLQAKEIVETVEKFDFFSFRYNIKAASRNYDFLASRVAKQKFVPSLAQINQEGSR